MTHSIKKVDTNNIELTVELTQDDLKKYVDRAKHSLSQDLTVDGFRKGKAPKEFVDKHVDQGQILEIALELAMKGSLAEVTELEKLDILNTSNLEIKENSRDSLKYKISLSIFPDFKLADFSEVKVKRREVLVSDQDVDATINSIRSSRANLIAKDGSIENGDRVEVDFEVKMDGKVIEGGVSKSHPLIVGGKSFIPGFEDNLIGMKKDEEKLFSLVAPKDYFQKNIAGNKLDFTVKICDIKLVQMPSLDDNFVKSLGKFKNLENLKESIRGGLMEEKTVKEKQRLRLEILDHIIKASNIPTSESMVDQQLDSMVAGFDDDLHSKGMELSLYLAHIGKTQEDLRKDWKSEAEKQIKMTLVLRKIAKDNKISASEEEIQTEINLVLQGMMARGELDGQKINQEAVREEILARITNEKALNLIERMCGV